MLSKTDVGVKACWLVCATAEPLRRASAGDLELAKGGSNRPRLCHRAVNQSWSA